MTNLIISLFNVGEGDKAEELYRQAMEVRPDDEILAEIKRAYLE
jgi:pentatricopeptide repeat protein